VNESEFNRIYNEYATRLYTYAVWLTGNRPVCDDIIQTVFMKLWKGVRLPADPREQSLVLYTITRHTTLDFIRKYKRFARFRLKYARVAAKMHFDTPDKKFFWETLNDLPELERTILFLHIRIGYSYREIGTLVDSNEAAVRIRAFRALKQLRTTVSRNDL
jgi:RNA polymerase sigma-70 factor (ECF subfamily)